MKFRHAALAATVLVGGCSTAPATAASAWSWEAAIAVMAIFLIGGLAIFGMWLKQDVRINVIALGLLALMLVVVGLHYAMTVDDGTDEVIQVAMEQIGSEASEADNRIEAMNNVLNALSQDTNQLLRIMSIVGAALAMISMAMGFLLQSGNPLSEPHLKVLDILDRREPTPPDSPGNKELEAKLQAALDTLTGGSNGPSPTA